MKALEIGCCEESGVPFLEIPPEFIWELLGHLTVYGVKTVYDYDTCCLTAYFLECDRGEAQRILDEWSESCGWFGCPERSAGEALSSAAGTTNVTESGLNAN